MIMVLYWYRWMNWKGNIVAIHFKILKNLHLKKWQGSVYFLILTFVVVRGHDLQYASAENNYQVYFSNGLYSTCKPESSMDSNISNK